MIQPGHGEMQAETVETEIRRGVAQLSRAMDLFDVADYGGNVEEGLARVRLDRAMVIGVESDFLFPIEQQQELATGLGAQVNDIVFHRLPSIQGHDSFLVDMDRFRPVIARYFRT